MISGLAMNDDLIKKPARRLKAMCTTGGTVKNRIFEIEGDRREKAEEEPAKGCFNAD
ncbi:MAG: hypothetical protein ACLFQ9_07125 [Desulfobacterales bacterium]